MTPRTDDLVVTARGIRCLGRYFPCTIGRGGISGNKCEGDKMTPRGKHRLVGILYRPDRMPRPCAFARPIRMGDLWSDDPCDRFYNTLVSKPYPHSHETLWRADRLYDLVIITDWNWPNAVKGRGSAIFIHRWRKPCHPTEGCIGLHPSHLLWIVQNITDKSRLIVP